MLFVLPTLVCDLFFSVSLQVFLIFVLKFDGIK